MKKATRREIKKAAIQVTLPAFKKFQDELRDVADQYGLQGAERMTLLLAAMEDMMIRCQFEQERIAGTPAPDFGMYTAEGNAAVFQAVGHMQGTGRIKAAMAILMDLANRNGTREAYDTAVLDEVANFVSKGRK